MKHTYETKGVCSRIINFELNDGIVTNVEFIGGCPGNLKAISILVDGMTTLEIKEKLKGNTCGNKSTSCADQLVKAIEEAENNKK